MTVKFIRGYANLAVILNTANLFSPPLTGVSTTNGTINYKKDFTLYLNAIKNTSDIEISNTGGIYDQITSNFSFLEQLLTSAFLPEYYRTIVVQKGAPVMMVIQYTNNYANSSQKIDTTATGFEVFGMIKHFTD